MREGRSVAFYWLAAFFAIYVLFRVPGESDLGCPSMGRGG